MKKKGKKRGGAFAVVVIVVAALVVGGLVFVSKYKDFNFVRQPEYVDSIVKYSGEYNLDPYFVAAVINTESGFDPQAVSRVGAIGLMQIMPETGEWIAGKLGISDYSEGKLLDPDSNIRFGCWYLNFLKERFNGDTKLIAAGYNAGHNRVDSWLMDGNLSVDGVSLDNVPFEETSRYVKKVDNAYDNYKKNYEIG